MPKIPKKKEGKDGSPLIERDIVDWIYRIRSLAHKLREELSQLEMEIIRRGIIEGPVKNPDHDIPF